MSDAIVAALGTLFGGGALVGIVQGWVSHKKGVRDTDVERDQTAFEQMKVILLEHKESIAELKAARDKDTRRLDDLSEENRLYRWTLIGVTDRLRQKPQGTVDDILDYLHERLPMLRKERDELAFGLASFGRPRLSVPFRLRHRRRSPDRKSVV